MLPHRSAFRCQPVLAVMLALFFAVPAAAQRFPGDADGDGEITLLDREAIRGGLLGTGIPQGNADANEDGRVDVADLVYLTPVMGLLEDVNYGRPELELSVHPESSAPDEPLLLSWQTNGVGLYSNTSLTIEAREPAVYPLSSEGGSFSTGIAPGIGASHYLTQNGWSSARIGHPDLSGARWVALPAQIPGEWAFTLTLRGGRSGNILATRTAFLTVSEVPAMRLTLNRRVAGPRDAMRATLQLAPGSAPGNVDLLAVLTLPDGGMLSLPGLSRSEYFFLEDEPAAQDDYTLFDRPLGEFGTGDYRLSVRMHESGTRTLLAMAHAEFTICDGLIAVSGEVKTPSQQPLEIPDPAATELHALDLYTGRTAARTQVASDGSYTLELAPGRYMLTANGRDSNGRFTARSLEALAVACTPAAREADLMVTSSSEVNGAKLHVLPPGLKQEGQSFGVLMLLDFQYTGVPERRDEARAQFDQYVETMRLSNPGLQIMTTDDLGDLLQQAAEGTMLGEDNASGQALMSATNAVSSTDAHSTVHVSSSGSGATSVHVSTVSPHTVENIARSSRQLGDPSQLAAALADAAAEQSEGLEEAIRARIPQPIIPILEYELASDTHPLIETVHDRRLLLEQGDPVELTVTARLLEGADDPPAPIADMPLTLQYREPPALSDWITIGGEHVTNANGEVAATVTISQPASGLGFFRAVFERENQVETFADPWLAYQFEVRPEPDAPRRWLFISADPGRWTLKPGDTTDYTVTIVTDPSIPPQAYTVDLSSVHGGGAAGTIEPQQVTVVTTQLAQGSSPIGRTQFSFTAPGIRGATDISADWTDPPACAGCPPVVLQSLKVWIDGGAAVTMSIPGGGGTSPQGTGPAQEGIITVPTSVAADLRVAGDPVPGLPVSFTLDGDGTLGIHDTLTGPQGRALTIFEPPVGMSGTVDITATGYVDGEEISETLTLSYEGRPYYHLTEVVLPEYFGISDAAMNNHAEVVNGQYVWRPGQGVETLPGYGEDMQRVGLDINDNGIVVGWAYRPEEFEESSSDRQTEPVRWVNGQIQRLGQVADDNPNRPLQTLVKVDAVNEAGQMAGRSTYIVGEHPSFPGTYIYGRQATYWDGATARGLAQLDGSSSYATDLNEAGMVVGRGTGSLPPTSYTRALVWQPGGQGAFLGDFQGNSSEAYAVNNHGQAVGWANNDHGRRAVLWLPAPAYGLRAGIHDLFPPGGSLLHANDINDSGQIVGWYLDQQPGYAFLWENGVSVDLNDYIPADSIYYIRQGLSINEHGQILCEALIDGDLSNRTLVILTPPEMNPP